MLLASITLALACGADAQEPPKLLAFMEPGFHAFAQGRTVVSWPVVRTDSASCWDGTYYVVPESGFYDITVILHVENVTETPMLVGVQVWRDEGIIFSLEKHVSVPFEDSTAATIPLPLKEVLREGERIHVEYFTRGESVLSGFPHESRLSIVRLP